VPNRPYVYMRLRPVKLFLAHDFYSPLEFLPERQIVFQILP